MSGMEELFPKQKNPRDLWRGEIAEAPDSPLATAAIRVQGYSQDQLWTDVRIAPRLGSGGAIDLPKVGDPVIVGFDDQERPWVVGWWPTSPEPAPDPVTIDLDQILQSGASEGDMIRWRGTEWSPEALAVALSELEQGGAGEGDVLRSRSGAWATEALPEVGPADLLQGGAVDGDRLVWRDAGGGAWVPEPPDPPSAYGIGDTVEISRASNQTFGNTQWLVNLCTIKDDADGGDSLSVTWHNNHYQINIHTTGLYLVSGYIGWATNSTGSRLFMPQRTSGEQIYYERQAAANSGHRTFSTLVMPLEGGLANIRTEAWQNSGGNLACTDIGLRLTKLR